MTKTLLGIAAALFLSSCASINPFHVPEGQGAYLKNRKEQKDKAVFIYAFISGMTPDGTRNQFFQGNQALDRVIYRIPTGKITLGLKILYFPRGGPVSSVGEALDISFKLFFSSDARSRFDAATSAYEILVVNPKGRVPNMQGINLNAVAGRTYRINCRVKNGKAYVWLEDEAGEKVSEVVRGIGFKHQKFWLWENLPAPAS